MNSQTLWEFIVRFAGQRRPTRVRFIIAASNDSEYDKQYREKYQEYSTHGNVILDRTILDMTG